MTCDECKSLGIPDYLCKNNRSNVEGFVPNEHLYRRHKFKGDEQYLKDNQDIISQIFKIHDDSYNKSSISTPTDVLLNDNPNYSKNIYANYGIIQIDINTLLQEATHIINGDQRVFKLVPIHSSTDCNYSHCEIQCYVDGVKAAAKPKSVNTVFRKILKDIFKVVKEAN